ESFTLDTKYEAIIVPTGTFLLLHKRDDSIKALQNFREHLSDGGRLIIDIFLQTDLSVDNISTRTWQPEKDEMITLESKIVDEDQINKHTISDNRYEKRRNGEL